MCFSFFFLFSSVSFHLISFSMTKQVFTVAVSHSSVFNWIEFSIWNVLIWERICWQLYISLMLFPLIPSSSSRMGFKQQDTDFVYSSKRLSRQTLPKSTFCSVILPLCLSYPITSKPTGRFQPEVDVWKTEVPKWKWVEIFFEHGFRLEEKDLFLTKGKMELSCYRFCLATVGKPIIMYVTSLAG